MNSLIVRRPRGCATSFPPIAHQPTNTRTRATCGRLARSASSETVAACEDTLNPCAEGAPPYRGPTSLAIPRARIDRVVRAPWYGTNATSDGPVRAVPPPEVGRGTTLGGGTGRLIRIDGETYAATAGLLDQAWKIDVGHSTVVATEVTKIKSKLLPRLAVLLAVAGGLTAGGGAPAPAPTFEAPRPPPPPPREAPRSPPPRSPQPAS